MSLYITGFIIALVLAVIVLIWIAYCMFVRERHRSEYFQYNISDLQRKNAILKSMEEDVTKEKKAEITAGVFILPALRKQNDEGYQKRPDYPESRAPVSHTSTEKLIEMLSDDADVHYRDGIYEVDSRPSCHSDV